MRESQLGTSSRRVSILSTIESSIKRSRRTRARTSRISWSPILFPQPIDVCFPADVLGQVQAPLYRAVCRRPRICTAETETRVQIADHGVLLGRNVVGAKSAYAATAGSLDRDVHGFELKLPAG